MAQEALCIKIIVIAACQQPSGSYCKLANYYTQYNRVAISLCLPLSQSCYVMNCVLLYTRNHCGPDRGFFIIITCVTIA